MRRQSFIALLVPALVAAACGAEVDREGEPTATVGAIDPAAAQKLDTLLQVLVARQADSGAKRHLPGALIPIRQRTKGGVTFDEIDVLIRADVSALTKIRALADVRTVTDSGIMTASVAVSQVTALASIPEVRRVEGAKRVHKTNEEAQKLTTAANGYTVGMNNPRTTGGAGVVVGVIDTGIDWTHLDFVKDSSEAGGPSGYQTRVKYYWDQSDTQDDKPPSDLGLGYGHEYTSAELDDALQNHDNTWNPADNSFGATAAGYPVKASARDTDGHGTHVAGSAAGDGSGSGQTGGAPDADLVIVKFDFDGARNTDAAIVDGIKYIFERAKALGKPAVINMSLGSDFGPHDGSTLEERGIDDLAGPGKVVVVAAGNPGANNWSEELAWGYALHGSAALGSEATTIRFPAREAAADDYVFFDVWYPAGNKCRVKIETPSGKVYPPTGKRYNGTWVTGSSMTGFNTSEGALVVGNGGDQFGWGDDNPDQEAYVEISNYYGTAPTNGTYTISLVPADANSTCAGTYHVWYGSSANVVKGWRAEPIPRAPTPRFGGRESDNAVTIGTPASADEAIAVAAYQSRDSWLYAYGTECQPTSSVAQRYIVAPLSYYDQFALGELAYFSGRGPRRDAVMKPEIAAPGVGIASSLSHFVRQAEWGQRCDSYFTGGPYHFGTNRVLPNLESTVLQGTSMATPSATGAIALLVEQKTDMTAECLRKLFSETARHDAATDTFDNTPNSAGSDTDSAAGTGQANNDWGFGKLDIASSLAKLQTSYPTCTNGCAGDSDCASGEICKPASDPCGCGVCEAAPPPPPPPSCAAKGTSCEGGLTCCPGSTCGGKPGKRVCK